MVFTLWKIIRDEKPDSQGIVFNAPRPLAGDKTWQGEFVHGIWYSSVIDIDDPYTRNMMETNLSLDAYVIQYFTKEEAIKIARDDYIARGYEDKFSEFSPAKLEELFLTNFENNLCQSTIEL